MFLKTLEFLFTLLIITRSYVFVPLTTSSSEAYACSGTATLSLRNKTYQIAYDISSLYQPKGTYRSDTSTGSHTHTYHFSVCGDLQDPLCPGSWCFEEVSNVTTTVCFGGIAKWNSTDYTTLEYFALYNETLAKNATEYVSTGLHITVNTYGQGENVTTCPNHNAVVHYNYACSPTTIYAGIRENYTECVFNVSYLSPAGCLTAVPAPAQGGSGSDNDELSGGSIFLIVVAFLALIYLILGCAYNSFYHGRVGMDAFPNKDSWVKCCQYVKAGCETSRDCVCFCCPTSGKSGEFQTLTK